MFTQVLLGLAATATALPAYVHEEIPAEPYIHEEIPDGELPIGAGIAGSIETPQDSANHVCTMDLLKFRG